MGVWGGGVLTHISHISMCRSKGYGFCAVSVWNRVWFSKEPRECINVFVLSIPNESERKNNMRFRNGFQKSFCWRSYLNDDEVISTYARSENGYRF